MTDLYSQRSFQEVEPDDMALVARAKAGDSAAFGALYEAHSDWLAKYLMPMHRWRDADVEDIVHETFMRVMDKLEGFRGEASFRKWLYQIARNLSLNYLRDSKPSIPLQSDQIPDSSSRDSETNSPIDSIKALGTKGLLELARTKLSPTEYDVFIMAKCSGLKHLQIAATLGISLGTVAHHVHEATRKLKEYFSVGVKES